jgi:hypothetical protein
MSPANLIKSFFEPKIKAGLGEIFRPGYNPMFHWIVMNVIKMSFEILLISNYMIPESVLPDPNISSNIV